MIGTNGDLKLLNGVGTLEEYLLKGRKPFSIKIFFFGVLEWVHISLKIPIDAKMGETFNNQFLFVLNVIVNLLFYL